MDCIITCVAKTTALISCASLFSHTGMQIVGFLIRRLNSYENSCSHKFVQFNKLLPCTKNQGQFILSVLRFNVPVNKFSVMSCWGHFLGINQYCGELHVPCSRTQQGATSGNQKKVFRFRVRCSTTMPLRSP